MFTLGFLSKEFGKEVFFSTYTLHMLPITLAIMITSGLVWYLFYKVEINSLPKAKEFFDQELEKLGPMSMGEKLNLSLFILTFTIAMFRPAFAKLLPWFDTTAIFVTMAFFSWIIPVKTENGHWETINNWNTTVKNMTWDVVFVTGAGIALASIIEQTKAYVLLVNLLTPLIQMGGLATTFGFGLAANIMTQFMNNTTTDAILLPIAAKTLKQFGLNPIPLIYLTSASAALGYALPAASGGITVAIGMGADPKVMLK
ncbi:MAG: SLC13 family permease [Bacillota bacterium]